MADKLPVEVNNKRDPGTKAGQGDYTMNEKDCNSYLSNMAASTSDCYGSDNKDTKGGTWQVSVLILPRRREDSIQH